MSEATATDSDLRAADGRVPGRRGPATRQRLLECTSRLLEHQTYRDLKVVDIAREAGTSPATFYQYFPDVTTAILALADDMAEEGSETLTRLVVDGPWKGAAGYATCERISEGFLAFWDAHWPLMRVMELTAAEGDQRFRSIRVGLLNEFTTALSTVVSEFQQGGRSPRRRPWRPPARWCRCSPTWRRIATASRTSRSGPRRSDRRWPTSSTCRSPVRSHPGPADLEPNQAPKVTGVIVAHDGA